ncbi:MAG: DUF423 domain-containing protein, partial [Elusimicrobia bacterium]|nr:DUF423 domain-containing protein [Elusimicrobiota bacterium]
MTSPSFWLRAGSLAMLASVAAGAFGAHALRGRLPPELLEVWETAARYMAYHGLALLAVAWLADRGVAGAPAAGCCFLAGIVLFCGSLMALA